MSRRLLPPTALPEKTNPYQPTTTSYNSYNSSRRQRRRNDVITIDTGLSDDNTTDNQSCYDYYSHRDHGYHASDRFSYGDRSFSEDSGSTRIPMEHENSDRFFRRYSTADRRCGYQMSAGVHHAVDARKVYPKDYGPVDGGLYQEILQEASRPVQIQPPPVQPPSNRPQSSMSSGVTSVILDGCGGKCQTFENVCYFLLQLIFMMGILIGVSLCIAGLVLRKSAARNLQVLVYIGILLAIVSGVLLGIQWNARNLTRKRKLAVRNLKRGPIIMETLNSRAQPVRQPLMAVQEGSRIVPQIVRSASNTQPDQQGIPWWRRRDLV